MQHGWQGDAAGLAVPTCQFSWQNLPKRRVSLAEYRRFASCEPLLTAWVWCRRLVQFTGLWVEGDQAMFQCQPQQGR